jgi:hypothetical protein
MHTEKALIRFLVDVVNAPPFADKSWDRKAKQQTRKEKEKYMDIDTLHLIFHDKLYDDLFRIAELLKHVPDDQLTLSDQAAAEFEGAEHGSCANDVRELWGWRLNGLRWLLMRVPRDRFIVAHTPSPDSNDLQMRPELMRTLAEKARSVEHFFTLCDEAARDYDRDRAEQYKKECPGPQLNSSVGQPVTNLADGGPADEFDKFFQIDSTPSVCPPLWSSRRRRRTC